MISSLDWPDLLKHFAERFHWPPPLVLDGMPVGQLWPFLRPGNTRRPHDPARVIDHINRRRALRGQPPLRRK